MNGTAPSNESSFVVFQMGGRRVALPSACVTELAPPVRLHTFPHATPLLEGVIVRRGHIVPVYRFLSAARNSSAQHFYLIARRGAQEPPEFAAISVAGECELLSSELQPADSRPVYIVGTIAINGESIDVMDMERLATFGLSPAEAQ